MPELSVGGEYSLEAYKKLITVVTRLEGRWELGGWVSEVGGKNSTDYHFILSDLGILMNMVYNSVHEFLSALWPEPSKTF